MSIEMENEGFRFCVYCGGKIEKTSKFCKFCGKAVQTTHFEGIKAEPKVQEKQEEPKEQRSETIVKKKKVNFLTLLMIFVVILIAVVLFIETPLFPLKETDVPNVADTAFQESLSRDYQVGEEEETYSFEAAKMGAIQIEEYSGKKGITGAKICHMEISFPYETEGYTQICHVSLEVRSDALTNKQWKIKEATMKSVEIVETDLLGLWEGEVSSGLDIAIIGLNVTAYDEETGAFEGIMSVECWGEDEAAVSGIVYLEEGFLTLTPERRIEIQNFYIGEVEHEFQFRGGGLAKHASTGEDCVLRKVTLEE